MSNEYSRVPQTTREIDLSDVWKAIAAGKKTIIAVTLLFLLAALAYVLTATPRYSGEAKVLVENQEGYLTRQDRSDSPPDEAAVASQVQVILSRDLARQAVRSLNLSGNPEFDPIAGGGGLIRQMVGLVSGSRSSTREDRIFEEYYKRLNVFALAKSRVVSIEFQSRDPALAARAANVIAELYIEMQANAKRDQARGSAEALGAQVAILRTKAAETDGRVEDFRSKSGLMMGANNTTLPSQQLAEINAQLASARSAQADSQARARLLRESLRAGRLNEVPDIANNELMRRVSEQRVTLRGQLALESRTLGPEHPRTKELNAQIASVESEMRTLAERTSRTLENDARIAGSRVEFLTAAVERQMRAVGTSGDDEVRLRELEREARLTKEQLEQNTQRWQEALARESSKATPGGARVISRAVEPDKPVSPKKIVVLFAAFGGLALSVFGVVAKTMIGSGPVQVSGVVGVPVVAFAKPLEEPAVSRPLSVIENAPAGDSHFDVGVEEAIPASDDISALVALISNESRRSEGMIVLVASADQHAASLAAVDIGRELTGMGRAVLIDLIQPAVASRSREGFSDVLDGVSTFGRVLHGEPQSPLHILDRGRSAIELGENLDNALVALARTYEYVVLAVAGENDVDLVLGLAPFVDRCIVARRAGSLPDASDALVSALEESGALAIDIVDAPDAKNVRPGASIVAA
ncbi:MAG: GumC family protein [Beijerinckiaceae bacterium]|nr:GumC family protein [Beijerinckiaceae bacterium]